MNEKLLLVVDDEPEIVAELSGYLNQKGYEVLAATNGLEAYNLFVRHDPVCVLTDYNMPVMNGLELLNKIKSTNKQVHVILISGVSDVRTITSLMKADAFDFLPKPLDLKEMTEIVELAIQKTKSAVSETMAKLTSAVLTHRVHEKNDEVSIVVINKDLDEHNVPALHKSMAALFSNDLLRKNVLFVLDNVKYINNIGLGLLIESKDKIEQSARVFRIIAGPACRVSSYLKSLGYDSYFKKEKNIDAFMVSIGGHS